MSAHTKATDEQVRAALHTWRGNVAASADALGMSEYGLRKRMERLGIGARALSFWRSTTTHNQPPATMHPSTQPVSKATGTHPQKPVSNNFSGRADSPTLLRMPTAEAAEPVRRAKAGPIRLEPEQVELLRDAKFDFMAKHRVEASESDLLQRFFRECFAEWSKRTLGKEKK